MQRPSVLMLAISLPSLPILIYLAAHATEGWQLVVVAAFLSGFVVAWLRKSMAMLVASYAAACSLLAWVVWVNL
jgi:hypothetical protein